jgi:hypothetical protein
VGRDGRYDVIIDGPASGHPQHEHLTLAEVTSALTSLNAPPGGSRALDWAHCGALG